MLTTCTKRYNDIPFAHRAPNHDGHCRFIHGHNWSFEFTFACSQTDENGFVVDFGKLQNVKAWLATLDHRMVISKDDPKTAEFEELEAQWLLQLLVIDDCSCEGLAREAYQRVNDIIRSMTNNRAWVHRVTVFEDTRNSSTIEKEYSESGIK